MVAWVLLLAIVLVANGNVLDERDEENIREVPGLTDEILLEAIDEAKREQDEIEKRTPRVKDLDKTGITLQSRHYRGFVPHLEPDRIHAMVMERTTRKLADKLGLEPRKAAMVLRGLKSRHLQEAFQAKRSIPFPVLGDCDDTYPYRSTDGSCNNIEREKLGAAQTAFSRLLEPDYADGISKPRVAKDKKQLPNARYVSLNLFRDVNKESQRLSHMHMIWGQFVDHDITHTASQGVDCTGTCGLKGECFGIPIPKGDNTFRSRGVKCIPLRRSAAAAADTFKPRDQVNIKSACIDASQLYGDSDRQNNQMRVTESGMLLEKPNPAGSKYKSLLPKQVGGLCFSSDPVAMPCFISGDFRVNVNPGLISMHTIWSHEHNRLVTQLRKLNPHWDATRLYFEARKIVGAMMQHITYNEYLPLILDWSTRRKYQLIPRRYGFYYRYSHKVDPSIINSFAGSAYRFGHSQIRNDFNRFLKNSKKPIKPPIKMYKFFDPTSVYDVKKGGLDSILRGLARDASQKSDGYFSKAVQEHLVRGPGDLADLPAINIQRGRDHGLPGYNAYRRFAGLKYAKSFSDFKDVIPQSKISKLKKIYKSPDDVDLYAGGLLERSVRGGILGKTFSTLLAIQFQRLRRGDRFWYENPFCPTGFTADQLKELRKVSLARVICDNGNNIVKIQKRVLGLPSGYRNRIVPCSRLRRVNLKRWIEIPGHERHCHQG